MASILLTATPSTLPSWLQFVVALSPLVTVGVVITAFLAYRQKKRADDRADWWARADKAIDMMLSKDNTTVNAGMVLVGKLSESRTARRQEHEALRGVVDAIVDGLIADSRVSNAKRARARRRRRRARWVDRLTSGSRLRTWRRSTLRRHTPSKEARG